MRLQKLEIKGFKSFADQTVVNFDSDVIGIVGPNGSGKSNIVDSIRWVLGEQKTKELRLDSMKSVIFNGTKSRKASGAATVSLTFENTKNLLPTEYNTITISRTLYSSGDSDYKLNNVTCRLKDITSLFLDTGIGSNSYAIIALDMVDDILTDKENARRRMFEQAAGISKYKMRKRETINKLKSTTEDLDRVEDLLFEIDSNLKSLEKQAKRTEKYFDLKAKYKELSIQLAQLKSADLKVSNNTLKAAVQKEEDSQLALETQLNTLEANLEAEKKGSVDQEQAVTAAQRAVNTLIDQIRQKESDRRMAEQRVQFVEQNRSKLEQQVAQASQQQHQINDAINRLTGRVADEQKLEVELAEKLANAEAGLAAVKGEHEDLRANLESVMKVQNEVERLVYSSEKDRAVKLNQISNLEQELAKSEESTRAQQEQMARLHDDESAVEKTVAGLEKRLAQLEQKEADRKTQEGTVQQAVELFNGELQDVNRKLDAARNEFQLTKSMVENLEGFPESIKFLSTQKEWAKTAPLLSDLIYVEENSRVAIENFLEPYLNYYVVQDKAQASQALNWLTQSQKGKANFFILDAFQDYEPPAQLMPEGQLATDLIECEPAYRKLFAFLLGNVVITEKDDLNNLVLSESIDYVSRSGQIIRRAFSVSGGSVGLFEGKKIGRKKNLERLEKAIRKLERDQDKFQEKLLAQRRKLEDLKADTQEVAIRKTNGELNDSRQRLVSVQTKLDNFRQTAERVIEAQKQRHERLEKLKVEIDAIDALLVEQQQNLAEAKSTISNTDTDFRKAAEALSGASSHYNEQQIAFIKQQNTVQALDRELKFHQKQLSELGERANRDQQTISTSGSELENLVTQIEVSGKELAQQYEARNELQEQLTTAEQKYFKAKGTINEIEDKIRKLNRQRMEVQNLLVKLKDQHNEVKMGLTALAERLRVEFGVSLNEIIKGEVDNSLDPKELTSKVERLKGRLDNYGEINPMAVEAYNEMKERHDNISTQRDDILKAKEDLMSTIQEIEETATTQFLEAFNAARLHFIEVFRSLFTEDDTCDLVLLEPDNPLESKIEIVAKPKGKRPQSISQLSGGEKTLTATALLFALYLLKPAPFCIFDEVDAPLDDANVEKFNKIIKKFSKESQFIIVTHNKGTMAAMDTIYGVYMPEMGVSKVSQVDFRSYDHLTIAEAV